MFTQCCRHLAGYAGTVTEHVSGRWYSLAVISYSGTEVMQDDNNPDH